jgi:hypothetical protein
MFIWDMYFLNIIWASYLWVQNQQGLNIYVCQSFCNFVDFFWFETDAKIYASLCTAKYSDQKSLTLTSSTYAIC